MVYPHDERLRQLCASLERRVEQASDLEVVTVPESRHHCVLRLSSSRGPVSVLRISRDEVTVTTSSNGLHAHAGDSQIIDELRVDLARGFAWDDVLCESADELAHLLVKHMRRRLRDADPEPKSV